MFWHELLQDAASVNGYELTKLAMFAGMVDTSSKNEHAWVPQNPFAGSHEDPGLPVTVLTHSSLTDVVLSPFFTPLMYVIIVVPEIVATIWYCTPTTRSDVERERTYFEVLPWKMVKSSSPCVP